LNGEAANTHFALAIGLVEFQALDLNWNAVVAYSVIALRARNSRWRAGAVFIELVVISCAGEAPAVDGIEGGASRRNI
jgi:hypothetical protein